MRLDKNTGKTIAFACVILFAGILFSTWVLPAATEDKSEQAVVMPVMLNNPQKIIESPAMKADPQKLYPAVYSLRVPLNTSQIDETVVQARNLFLKNVSEDVEYLFNLKIDSVIMEKYAEVWKLMPGKVTVPTEPVWNPDGSQSPDDSSSQSGDAPEVTSSAMETGESQSGDTDIGEEPQSGDASTAVESQSGSEDLPGESQGENEDTGEEPQSSSSELSDNEKELEEKLQQEEYERQQQEYQKKLQEYEMYLYEEAKGDAFSLDILFTDAKSATWRITAYGYADEVIALHCVKEDIDMMPVSIFQESRLEIMGNVTTKISSAISLFRSRIDSVEDVNDIYNNGYYLSYIELCVESPTSEFYWNIYGWTPDEDRLLIAGFRADTNTPVCYGLVRIEDNLYELLAKYGYDPAELSGLGDYGY